MFHKWKNLHKTYCMTGTSRLMFAVLQCYQDRPVFRFQTPAALPSGQSSQKDNRKLEVRKQQFLMKKEMDCISYLRSKVANVFLQGWRIGHRAEGRNRIKRIWVPLCSREDVACSKPYKAHRIQDLSCDNKVKVAAKIILAKICGRNAEYKVAWRLEADFRLWQPEHKLET